MSLNEVELFDKSAFPLCLRYDGGQIALRFVDEELTNRYLWGPRVDQLLADEQIDGSAEIIWPVSDHLNTPRDLLKYNTGTDTLTNANHREFDSFGNMGSRAS